MLSKHFFTISSQRLRSRLSGSFCASPTMNLIDATVSGAFAAIVAAKSFTCASSSASGSTRFTSPIVRASVALYCLADMKISFVNEGPTMSMKRFTPVNS